MLGQLIIQSDDSLYPLKYTINGEIDVAFPLSKVIDLLEELNFRTTRRLASYEKVIELRKGTSRVYLTEKEIAFSESLPTKLRDSLHSQLFALLVTRVRILNQAAIQNSEAAKINLLQNQRRACVSDAYYAVFTSIGSLIEHIKDNCLSEIFARILEDALDEDPEDRRNHFTPKEAEKLSIRFCEIVSNISDKEIVLEKELCDFSTEKLSRRNPFVWAILSGFILYKHLLKRNVGETNHEEKLIDEEIAENDSEEIVANSSGTELQLTEDLYYSLLNSLAVFMKSIDVESFAIGVSGREGFEENFTEMFICFRQIFSGEKEHEELSLEETCAILCCFFLYSYALRQMADYEASFDSRISIEVISKLCYFTELFTKIVDSFTSKIAEFNWGTKVQQLNSVCSRDVVPGYQGICQGAKSIYSLGGILVNPQIDILQTTKSLLKNPAYAPALVHGKLYSPQDGTSIVLERKFPIAPISLKIIITESGVVWIDVYYKSRFKELQSEMMSKIHPLSIEKIIVRTVINSEILTAINHLEVLYLGGITTNQEYSKSLFEYMNDLLPMHMSLKRQIHDQLVRSVSKELQLDFRIIDKHILPSWIEDEPDFQEIDWLLRRRIRMGSIKSNSVLLIAYHLKSINLSQKEQFREQLKRVSNENNLESEIFYVSDDFLNELIIGDDIFFNEKIVELSQKICTEFKEILIQTSGLQQVLPID